MNRAKSADRDALASLGAIVRARLAGDPAAYRVPVENAEVFAIADFLNPQECDHVVAMIDAVARPSELFDDIEQGRYRSSYSGDVDPSDSFVRMIERRLSDLLGIDPSWGETMQGQRYHPGQEFKDHCDWFDTQAYYWPGEVERGGQRSWTAMVFLNDVEAGGATEFPLLDISVRPQRGVLLTWNNALPDGTPNDATMHAARPVEAGVKYVITKWFRTRPWH